MGIHQENELYIGNISRCARPFSQEIHKKTPPRRVNQTRPYSFENSRKYQILIAECPPATASIGEKSTVVVEAGHVAPRAEKRKMALEAYKKRVAREGIKKLARLVRECCGGS